MFKLPNLKKHKIEIAIGVFGILVLWYLKKRGAFYGEGSEIMMMPMDAGGGAGGMKAMKMGANQTALTALCADMPSMDMKKFDNCINAGVDVAQCAACFGGGNKIMGGLIDTLNFENCQNEGKSAEECRKRSTFGQGRAGVKENDVI